MIYTSALSSAVEWCSNSATTWASAGSNAYLQKASNLGIGTPAPAFPLDVVGTARFAGNVLVGSNLVLGADLAPSGNHTQSIGSSSNRFGAAWVDSLMLSNLDFTGSLTKNGAAFAANAATSNFCPASNGAYALGSVDAQWRNLSLSGDAAITFGSGASSITAQSWAFIQDYMLPPVNPAVASTASNRLFSGAAQSHSALIQNGQLFTFGLNASGQLGQGDTSSGYSVPALVAASSNAAAVCCGGAFTVVLNADGNVWGMGANACGQLGCDPGSAAAFSNPVGIALSNVTSIAAGWDFALFGLSNGSVVGLGNGARGQLGSGSALPAINSSARAMAMPAAPPGSSAATAAGFAPAQIACGAAHTCLVLANGAAYLCGDNSSNQLGFAASVAAYAAAPGRLAGLQRAVRAACGAYHTAIATSYGDVYTMGANALGQLGNGTAAPAAAPQIAFSHTALAAWDAASASNIGSVYALGAGAGHTVLCTNFAGSSNPTYVWGDNTYGQLGLGTADAGPYTSPTLLGYNAAQVGCGQFHTVMLSADLNVFSGCGNDVYGQTGDGQLAPSPFAPGASNACRLFPNQLVPCARRRTMRLATGVCETNFTAYVGSDGTLYTYGINNTYGQLGREAPNIAPGPAPVSTFDQKIVAATIGNSHGAAIDASGRLFTWGYNSNGQLGNGSTKDGYAPVKVTGVYGSLAAMQAASAVACGSYHTVALDSVGNLHSWGLGGSGQLGNNTTASSPVPVQISGAYGSLASASVTVVAVACGSVHTVALDSTGKLHSWGMGGSGQLGNNTTASSLVPVQISGAFGSLVSASVTVVAVACGSVHTVALDSTGKVHAWGADQYGVVGNNSPASSLVPVQISGAFGSLVSASVKVVAVACGSTHTVALDSTGKVHIWGYNNHFQLGNNTNASTLSRVPLLLSGSYGSLASASIKVTAITTGFYFTVALDSTGSLHSWGTGPFVGSQRIPFKVTVMTVRSPGTTKWYLSRGYGYHKLIRDAAQQGSAYLQAAGDNTYGQLGDGTSTYRFAGLATSTLFASAVVASANSLFHSAVALADGTVYAWGRNTYFECGLASGANVGSMTASPIAGLGATSVACGTGVTLILTASGTVLAMGTNLTGMLGSGAALATNTSASGPVAVAGLSGVTAIAAGENHACALDGNGNLWCWGANAFGQFGVGTTSAAVLAPVMVPLAATGGYGVLDVACGWGHTLIVNAYNVCLAAGLNCYGQLGKAANAGTPAANAAFAAVAFPASAAGVACATYPVNVACGPHHSVVLMANGTVRAFGLNDRAQLGLPGATVGAPAPLSYPPAPLTGASAALAGNAYGDGTYVATASSSAAGSPPYAAFAAPGPAGAPSAWRTAGASYGTAAPYAYAAGVYSTTAANAAVYAGEWLQLQLPVAATLTKLSYGAGGGPSCAPGNFAVLGSGDGAAWDLLGAFGGLSSPLGGSQFYYMAPTAAAYTYFRVVVLSLAGNGGSCALGGGVQLHAGAVYRATPVKPDQYRGVVFVSASVNTTYVEATLPREMVTYNSAGAAVTSIFTKPRSYGSLEWASGENALEQGAGGAAADSSGVVLKSGALHTWGANSFGQVGNNTTSDSAAVPVQITGASFGSLSSGAAAVVASACGGAHRAALDSAGRVHSWGFNGHGQLGIGSTADSLVPVLVSGSFGSLANASVSVVAVACGQSHTVALDSAGRVHAWGFNGYGQLGSGSTADSHVPVLVSGSFGSLASASVSVVAIACGQHHAVALDSAGRVHSWGQNVSGQLGNGSTADSAAPTLISGSFGSLADTSAAVAVAVACGCQFSAVLDSAGNVHTWGDNGSGQLGNNSTASSPVPVKVSGQFGSLAASPRVSVIACGGWHVVALDSSGAIHAWGSQAQAQLWTGVGGSDQLVPVCVTTNSATGTTAACVAGGRYHSVLVDTYGRVVTVGYNGAGELGVGSLSSTATAQLVTGAYGSLATVASGSLFWNFTGQHRCFVEGYTARTLPQIEGLVVSACLGRYITTNRTGDFAFMTGQAAITTNDALPVVALSPRARDKTAFGVVSLTTNYDPLPDPTPDQLARQLQEGDQRAEINSVGEGAMWVCDAGGAIEAGDYVTTSAVPGYGMLQAEPCVCNFTVGKATMSCDFSAPRTPVLVRQLDQFGNNAVDAATGMPVFAPLLTLPTTEIGADGAVTTTDPGGRAVTAPAYRTRYLAADGTQISADAYAAALAADAAAGAGAAPSAYRAAFVGVTYHCG